MLLNMDSLTQTEVFADILGSELLAGSLLINIALAGLTLLAIVYLARDVEDTRSKAIILSAMLISVVSISSYTGLLSGVTVSYLEMPAGHALAGEEVMSMWGRYLTWAFSTPFILIALGMLARSDKVTIGTSVAFTIAMNVTGLAAALTTSSVVLRWFWYVLSSVFFLVIVYIILNTWTKEAEEAGTSDIFGKLKILTIITWFGYPVVWFLGVEGMAYLPEVWMSSWAYSLLDVVAKYVVTILIVQYVAKGHDAVTGGDDYGSV